MAKVYKLKTCTLGICLIFFKEKERNKTKLQSQIRFGVILERRLQNLKEQLDATNGIMKQMNKDNVTIYKGDKKMKGDKKKGKAKAEI